MSKRAQQEIPVIVTAGRGGKMAYYPTEHYAGGYSKPIMTHFDEDRFVEFIESGILVVDTRTIPEDAILRWAIGSPMIDVDLDDDIGLGEVMDRMNVRYVSPKEYARLAQTWGATIYENRNEVFKESIRYDG